MSEERCAMCKEAGFPDVLAHFKALPKGQTVDGKGRPAMCWDHKHGKVPRFILEAQGKKQEDKVDQRPLSEQLQEKVDKNSPTQLPCKRKVSPDCEVWLPAGRKMQVCKPCWSWLLKHGKPGKEKPAKKTRGPWQVNDVDEGALSSEQARELIEALWKSASAGEKLAAALAVFAQLPMVFRLAMVQTIMKCRVWPPAELQQPHATVQERGETIGLVKDRLVEDMNRVVVPAKDRLAAAGVEEPGWPKEDAGNRGPEDVGGNKQYISAEEMVRTIEEVARQ